MADEPEGDTTNEAARKEAEQPPGYWITKIVAMAMLAGLAALDAFSGFEVNEFVFMGFGAFIAGPEAVSWFSRKA